MGKQDDGNDISVSEDGSPCNLSSTSPTPKSVLGTTVGHLQKYKNTNVSVSEENLVPPKITPFSGVLDKGKIVVRPIAFKPIGLMTNSTCGGGTERYGSTPILTRPGSQLTLYGSSTDLRHHFNSFNYSPDRKSLPSASSPPLGMVSLSSLPQKLHAYDSLESVRNCKSPGSTSSRNNSHGSLSNKTKSSSFRMTSNAESSSSLLDLTPSPSDSGVAELEAALRERDSELVYLRQTMEHNEQAIIRVYQEKERNWERDKRRLNAVHENRLKTSAQKVLKLEQMLMMQTYQAQQEKKRLREEAERAARETTDLRQEVDLLRGRLEETEWGLCQKAGEISLLKAQLKEAQGEHTSKGHELIHLRNQLKDLKMERDRRESEICVLVKESKRKENELESLRIEKENLREELKKIQSNHPEPSEREVLKEEVATLRREIVDVCQVLKEEQEDRIKLMEEMEKLKKELEAEKSRNESFEKRKKLQEVDNNGDAEDYLKEDKGIKEESPIDDLKQLNHELHKLKNQLLLERTDFEQERITWAQEKEKVLRYQRQLQLNYVQMFRRTKTLEAEVGNLTMELELETKAKDFRNSKKLSVPTVEMGTFVEL